MTARISIRHATEHDAGSVARLAEELGYAASANVMAGRIRASLASPADLLIVAVDATGPLVGWLQAHASNVIESGFRVEIVGLIVSAAARRSGVGRLLVAEAERWARSLSAETIVVRSNVVRAESHQFYPAMGYEVSKTQTVYRKKLR